MTARKKTATKKKARKGKGRNHNAPVHVSMEQYETMYASYSAKQDIATAAKAAGVAYNTAQKYITGKASPDMGMPAIHPRWVEAEKKIQEAVDRDLIRSRRRNLQIVREAIRKVSEKVSKFEAEGLSENRVAASLDKLVRLEERLLGANDQNIGVDLSEQRFEGWTKEQLLDYARSGAEPVGAASGVDDDDE